MVFHLKFNVTANYSSLRFEKAKFEHQFGKLFQKADLELKIEWGQEKLLSIVMSFEDDGEEVVDNIEIIVDFLILFGMTNIKGTAEGRYDRPYNFNTEDNDTIIQTISSYNRGRIGDTLAEVLSDDDE
jgi:hypothetical protein